MNGAVMRSRHAVNQPAPKLAPLLEVGDVLREVFDVVVG